LVTRFEKEWARYRQQEEERHNRVPGTEAAESVFGNTINAPHCWGTHREKLVQPTENFPSSSHRLSACELQQFVTLLYALAHTYLYHSTLPSP